MRLLYWSAVAAGVMTLACSQGTVSMPTNASRLTEATTSAEPAPTTVKRHIVAGKITGIEKPTRAIENARVDIVAGDDAGRFVMSDARGNFELSNVTAGTISVRVTKSGFAPFDLPDMMLVDDAKLMIEMLAAAPVAADGTPATGRCNDGTWTWSETRAEACLGHEGLAYGTCPGPFCKND